MEKVCWQNKIKCLRHYQWINKIEALDKLSEKQTKGSVDIYIFTSLLSVVISIEWNKITTLCHKIKNPNQDNKNCKER